MSANLRKLARGQECQVRLPGVCCGDPATTVLAHVRLIGISGMGLKAPDLFGSWACVCCHDAIDHRAQAGLDAKEVRIAELEGMVRTQAELIKMGALKW